MANYKGTILDITEIESKSKGTPGLQVDLELTYKEYEGEFQPIDSMKRSVWLYFPKSSQEAIDITLKKFAVIGWDGGPLSQNKHMIGRTVDVESYFDNYNGEAKEKFDFPLPRRQAEKSDNAAMVIDQILASSKVPSVKSGAETPAEKPPERNSVPANAQDEDVPF